MTKHPVHTPIDANPEGWLVPNHLKDEADQFYFEAQHSEETRTNEDVAKAIWDEGSEISYETILSIIERVARVKKRMLFQGFPVQDDICRLELRVHGTWHGQHATFHSDPHRSTIAATTTASTREDLANVTPHVLGIKQDVAYIDLITDLTAKKSTPPFAQGDILEITGERIKIFPENEAGLGIFFVPELGGAPIPVTYILYNFPGKLVFQIPLNLNDADYKIRVVTRFSNSKVLLKEPRIIESKNFIEIYDGILGKSQPKPSE